MATRKKKNNIGAFGHPIYGKGFAKYGEMRTNGSSEIPNDLEEAADTYKNCYSNPNCALAMASKRAFIAGAKWQAEHQPLPEDTVLFNKGVEEGKRLMMKEAEPAEIGYFNHRGLSILTEKSIERMPVSEGDKVRVIIIPNTEEK